MNLLQRVTVMMRMHSCVIIISFSGCMPTYDQCAQTVHKYAQVTKDSNVMATALWYREELTIVQAQSSWLQRSVHTLAKHKKSLLAGAAAGLAVGAGLWMTR